MTTENNTLWNMINELLESSNLAIPLIKNSAVKERLLNATQELELFREIAIYLGGVEES